MSKYPSIRPENYYDEYGEAEWERLDADPKTRYEFENTVAYLDERLPDSGHVLDAGGAAGRYAVWLAERGYEVTLADVSDTQRDIAREKAAEHGVADCVTVEHGDVRDLPYDEAAFDAVCCLGGPLSHVVDSLERARAARELRRVAAPGAPVFVSVMGLVAVLQQLVRLAGEHEQEARQLPGLLDGGTYDASLLADAGVTDPNFVECHFFRAAELRRLLTEAGLSVDTVAGLEGVASNAGASLSDASETALGHVDEVVTDPAFREDPTVADLSEHILAVAIARCR
ncbi:MAG: methyltransferase domain-containing protein [Halobacteriaceae archaeon]